MKFLELINPENVAEEEAKEYRLREAVRAVVLDEEGNVALLHVTKENYYKLPGGGIEEAEDKMLALTRECKEEIGCNIEVLTEVGFIIEHRRIFSLKQISFCYLAKVRGQKEKPDFTESEKENGFEQVWLPFERALKVLSESKATCMEGSSYIVPRDTKFLKEAKNLIN